MKRDLHIICFWHPAMFARILDVRSISLTWITSFCWEKVTLSHRKAEWYTQSCPLTSWTKLLLVQMCICPLMVRNAVWLCPNEFFLDQWIKHVTGAFSGVAWGRAGSDDYFPYWECALEHLLFNTKWVEDHRPCWVFYRPNCPSARPVSRAKQQLQMLFPPFLYVSKGWRATILPWFALILLIWRDVCYLQKLLTCLQAMLGDLSTIHAMGTLLCSPSSPKVALHCTTGLLYSP